MDVGIIGSGTQVRAAHLPVLSKNKEININAISDINEKSAKLLAKKYNIPNVYQDYTKMLNRDDLDFVVICTPNHLHKKMIMDSAVEGKHVVVEKPMTTTVKDADEVIKTCKDNNVKLCVVHNYRLFPCVKEAKNRLERGRLGELITINAHAHVFSPIGSPSTHWIVREDSGGIIDDIGPHIFDIVLYLHSFKDIRRIYAVGGNFGGKLDLITNAQILLEFKNESTAFVDLSWMSGTKELALYLQGTGGLINLDIRNNYLEEIHQYKTPVDDVISFSRKMKTFGRDILSKRYFSGAKYNYMELYKDFIEALEKNKTPPITGEEARQTIFLIEKSIQSIKEKEIIIVK